MVNPGGPGASAVDTVAGMGVGLAGTPRSAAASTWSASTPAGSATPRPKCVAAPTPSSTPTDGNPMVDYSPAGVAHIEDLYRQFAQDCVAPDGQGVPGQRRHRVGGAGHGRGARRRSARTRSTISGSRYGTELGAAYAQAYPDRVRAMVLDGAVDPTLDPIEENIRQMAGFQTAFNDYAADCARSAGLPAGHRPRPVRQPLPPTDRPAGRAARRGRRTHAG